MLFLEFARFESHNPKIASKNKFQVILLLSKFDNIKQKSLRLNFIICYDKIVKENEHIKECI